MPRFTSHNPKPNPAFMRSLLCALLFLGDLVATAQKASLFNRNERFHGGVGITAGNMLFNSNIASGFSFDLEYNFVQWKNASISFGTNMKIGAENKDGLGFPYMIAALFTPPSDLPDNRRWTSFGEIPLFMHFNFFAGSNRSEEPHASVGFYFGGGISGLFTGITNPQGD